MSKPIIQITKSAHERLSYLVKQYNSKNIFLSLKMIENNKFSQKSFLFKTYYKYNIEPFKYKSYDHLDYVQTDNYNLYICEYGKKHIINTTIDWKKGFMKDHFVFSNPNSEFEDMENNTFITKYK
jgi:Fe-S cluster assembly iron-binding protein IscA